MLKIKNITKNYYVGDNTIEALKGINIEFRKSEFVSILGPSGCGKTTLLNIVGGLDRYTSGDLIINGVSTKDFSDYDWDSYRNHSIGFVFQSYNLINHQNVLTNVELALTLSGISKSERKKRAIEALKSVGLEDQIYKRPNQLSGGQMQRVAIARALVNNPEIILADEPTGALDSETSAQIMDILKEISKDRLIIMVTHNPDISKKYSTRIIRLLDGEVIDDSNPYHTPDEKQDKQPKVKEKRDKKERKQRHTAMSFITALALSLRNLITKKGRTILTAFAGSIGIIGISLVLAVSNGFQTYINKMQSDTLSAYPLTISESATDYTALMGMNMRHELEEYPAAEKIYINKISELIGSSKITNDLSDEYINNVINNIDKKLYHTIEYQYGVNINIFKDVKVGDNTFYSKLPTSSWAQLATNEAGSDPYKFFKTQYDVIGSNSRLPENKNEIVLVVNSFNQISDIALKSIGIMENEGDNIDFDKIIGQTYKIILNNNLYTYNDIENKFNMNTFPGSNSLIPESIYNLENEETVELKVVGIVRPNKETEIGSIKQGAVLGYSVELTDYVLNNSENSEIVKWMMQEENKTKDPLTGKDYNATADVSIEELRHKDLVKFGGVKKPKEINIFPVDFDSKMKIKEYLDQYNETKKIETMNKYYLDNNITEETATPEQKKQAEILGHEAGVYYVDIMGVLVSSLNTLINAISIVLIVFTSISLVVSSIMIGIITYISVLERTKEIGVLRSIGARKKDISRVFNAETLIIGFIAGLIGIMITFIASFPLNVLMVRLVKIDNIVLLNPLHAIILIAISMFLTLVAGLIPSRLAAKKDPVVALRTE
mgnify:CR=1 FL=1